MWYFIVYLLGLVVVYFPLERELLEYEGALYRYPGDKKVLCATVSLLWPLAIVGCLVVVVYYLISIIWRVRKW